ncbi:MAG: asparagine synthase B [Gammaproteobacteria bacterium]|nr:asparagine synthase B [Gammaproteobacteria bacterium]NIR83220.1 asparagine synthase B [Gammaproteobacteria bacterium]NIR91028.1 asparagine synthase B [Gammaproteobacteria bacterium]NIU04385.1 asparagine synthase B [Gammaproteobacteria bacterium]NIV52608.1 asparagine synthase B [Gammaproteobacteria bacterium]
MCGIAALWGDDGTKTILDMLSRLSHRGPDGRGLHLTPLRHTTGPATLGHVRLAIIDPAGGRQPMVADDVAGAPALVCNGMIYNDRDLRDRLADVAFKTGSDSESILRGFLAWGDRIADELDGMFAFVLVDGTGHVLAARDPLGIKPLYMGRVDGRLAFASEIKALAGVAEQIEEFPPGHVFHSRRGFRRYYEVPRPHGMSRTEEETFRALRETLEKAVVKRLRTDVPLGAFLSGGLDSSIIAAIAREHVDELHTFSVGLEGSSDLHAARKVAAHLGTIHHEYVIDPQDIVDVLPRVLNHLESFDRDLVRSAVPTYFVAKLAAREVKVVLTGEGADELFAGYSYYSRYDDPGALQRELRRSLTSMHNVNLQRVDRMSMAHGLEARVPFLDTTMIALAMTIPATWKQRSERGCDGEKWVLRKAFEDRLPAEIVWRAKLQFDQGSGFDDYLAAYAARQVEAGEVRAPHEGRSAEESLYRQLLGRTLPDPERVLRLTAHWSADGTGKAAA